MRVASEFDIPWIRRPFDLPLHAAKAGWKTRLVSNSFNIVRRRFQHIIASRGYLTTDHFAGFQLTGRYDADELAALIRSLPEGLTEFMCHPGFCTAELMAARTRLKESRRRELEALTSPQVRTALEESKVQLTRYCEIRPHLVK